MNHFVVSIGSNSLDKDKRVNECFKWLEKSYRSCIFSTSYITKALNGKDFDYVNAVASFDSDKELDLIVKELKDYERLCGRTPQCKINGSIPIDIDVVVYNREILRKKDFDCDYFQLGWKQLKF